MLRIHSCTLSRRTLLLGGGAALLVALAGARSSKAADPHYRLTAGPCEAPLLGWSKQKTNVWAYDKQVPGPTLHLRQGVPIRIAVENRLDEGTTVHWHGIRLPIGMDGVPGISQPPIRPGEDFVYEFTPPDAGTFWYHPHVDGLQQIGRGLSGALVVAEAAPPIVDRDLLWLISDWRLGDDGQIAGGFGNAMDAMMSGRVGNTVTLNGIVSSGEPARAGERIRLRLVNASLARIMALRIEGHRPVVVATDGQPCDPHESVDGRLILGPAMRIDVMLDMEGKPGQRYRVLDDFYAGLEYTLTELVYASDPPLRDHPSDAVRELPPNPLPKPDLSSAERHDMVLQGGMMGGGALAGMGGMMGGSSMGGMMGGSSMGGMMGGSMMGGSMMGGSMMSGTGQAGAAWVINGSSMTGDGRSGMTPLLSLKVGQSCVLTLRNQTAWWHPMHLHGHSFSVLSRNGSPVPHHQWGDTVLISPKETVEIAFVAGSPGDWMLHCHVMDHQMAGLMGIIRIA